ncbi:MAG: phospholipase D-like domain-containing protein [Bacteroidota bacterium]
MKENQLVSVNLISTYPIQTWSEPDNEGKTVIDAIANAQYSIDISIYELGGPHIVNALIAAKSRGVYIRIMFNGQFFVKDKSDQLKYQQQTEVSKSLLAAPGTNQVETHWSCNNFNITHQKTIIIDARKAVIPGDVTVNRKALVMTLNLSAYQWLPGNEDLEKYKFWGNGYPNTAPGTRDFGVVLSEPELVNKIQSIFDSDFNCAPGNQTNDLATSNDGLVWSNGSTGFSKEGYYPSMGAYPSFDQRPQDVVDQGNSRKAHMAVIKQAKYSLIIYNEEMNDQEIVNAIVQAAESGVKVRVLMTEGNKNNKLFDELYKANVEIRLFRNATSTTANKPEYMYIHAKMILADYGEDTAIAYVGSENISGNSLNFNRELGVIISGSKDNQLFSETFESDWKTEGLMNWHDYASGAISEKYDETIRSHHKYYPAGNESETTIPPMPCGPVIKQ